MPRAPRIRAHHIGGALYCTSLVALALGVGLAIDHLLHVQNVLLVFLPVILLAAVRYGFWMASWISILSVLATSYFFAEPRYSFAVSDTGNVWALAIFFAASGLTASVAAQARLRAEALSYHSRVVEQLYAFTSRLAGVSGRAELDEQVVREVAALLGAEVVLLRREAGGGVVQRASAPSGIALGEHDKAAARDALTRADVERGDGQEGSAALSAWRFLPVRTRGGVAAVLGIRDSALEQAAAGTALLDLLVEQIAVNLERTELAAEKRRVEVLAETEKLRTALLTSISHDLKTPLASILGNVTSLRDYGHLYDDPTRAEMLELAETETLRLNRFVDNLLNMTRIDAGAIKPSAELIDLADVVGSALKRLEKSLARHAVHMELDDALPMIPLDFVLTEQVVVNLLDNAAKYSPPGTTIEVVAEAEQDAVVLRVRDEGPGVPAADAERIFERFFRVETTDGRPAGTGLGLAICKGFVEAMGGSIRAANRRSGAGAEFTVVFGTTQPGATPE